MSRRDSADPMSEAQARRILRAEARRTRLLMALSLPCAFLLYLGFQIWLLDRPLGESLISAALILCGVGLVQYLFFGPVWIRRPGGPLVEARVERVGTSGSRDEVVVLRRGDVSVRVVMPRGTSGFRRGDTVLVCPRLDYGNSMGLVVPEHVSSTRPVLTVRGSAA
ncbi:hypothetical protein [Serinicoccus marinus]|uniref:hypothetical protein n=1 Tax=Serinicoccus marinus TaxID=247333 RepID=UPI0024913E48|nr:hypothetical protein [Serinicoccus marinus]